MPPPDPTLQPPAQGQRHASPPQGPQTHLHQAQASPEAQRNARLRTLVYNSSIAICLACPVVALLPPRKLDLFTFGLGITFLASAGYATEQKTGRGLLWHVSSRLPSAKRRERERLAREAEERDAEARAKREREEMRRRWREEEERRVRERGWFKRIWYGKEEEDWAERRAEMERKSFWGEKKEDEDETDD